MPDLPETSGPAAPEPASPGPGPSGAAAPSPPADDRIRLVVVYGGRSAEHEVSCISAYHVLRAADPARYAVSLLGITTSGRWVDAGGVPAALAPGRASLPSPDSLGATPAQLPASVDPLAVIGATPGGPVVVFPLLHGPYGEDGTVQGLLETAGLPYVGAGVSGSATAMDKGLTKAVLAAAGLPQVRALVRREHELDESTAKTVEAELGWPVFVKPANLGSSIGISRAGDAAELEAALELARRYDEWVVIEEAVSAREIEVGVLGYGADLQASVAGEIVPSRDFYDFEDKYLAGTATSRIPADIPADVAEEARRLALVVCRELRVDGMARVDFFYEEPGRGLLVNEVNTIPGFTPISQYPQLWAASGVDYPALVDELVRLAVVRQRRRAGFDVRRRLP